MQGFEEAVSVVRGKSRTLGKYRGVRVARKDLQMKFLLEKEILGIAQGPQTAALFTLCPGSSKQLSSR